MKPEVKEAWLKALRSGEYAQTINSLHRIKALSPDRPVGFCCLGVLCEIAVENEVIEKIESSHVEMYGEGHSAFLPPEVQSWAGLESHMDTDQGTIFYLSDVEDLLSSEQLSRVEQVTGGRVSVADLNDAGVDFETIADIIERVF